MSLLGLTWLRRLTTQMAILVVLTAFGAHVATFIVLGLLSGNPHDHRAYDRDLEAAAMVSRLLDGVDAAERAALLARLPDAVPHVRYDPPGAVTAERERGRSRLGEALGRDANVVRFQGAAGPRVGARLSDGAVISIRRVAAFEDRPAPPGLSFMLATAGSLVVGLALLSLWAARTVSAPLARFENAVAQFEIGGADERLDESGPVEIQRLARAFNAMRDRVKGMVDDRTRMLAAVGHDLRTPVTRLMIRADDVETPAVRADIQRDLSLMERMVRSALAFLSTLGAPPLVRSAVDLPALLQTVCDDFVDMGAAASYDGPARLRIACDADRIRRAVANLVDNAVKFGGEAAVRLEAGEDALARVIVEDRGPGVPEVDLERVKGGFVRGEEARTFGVDSGGFGLGLAIATEAAEAHGGSLTLENRESGGLRAVLALPRASADG